MSKKIVFETQATFTAEAGVDNPNLGWLEFILTDNRPNKNKQGIKAEQFKSLVNTGIFMPIKMAQGTILPDHSDAEPLGPIVELVASETQVSGKSAIWKDERPDDYALLKARSTSGEPINISWEIAYMASEEEAGIEWLVDPILTAATIVGLPAYDGRTPILAVASETDAADWTRAYINNLPDSAFLYIQPGGKKDDEGKTVPRDLRHLPYKDKNGSVDLPHLKSALSRLGQPATGTGDEDWLTEALRKRLTTKARRLLQAQSSMEDDVEELEKLQAQVDSLETEKQTWATEKQALETELTDLRQYKQTVEKEKTEAAKLETCLGKFSAAGIELSADEIAEKKAIWLELPDEALDYFIETLKKAKTTNTNASAIPDVSGTQKTNIEIVREGLKELRKK